MLHPSKGKPGEDSIPCYRCGGENAKINDPYAILEGVAPIQVATEMLKLASPLGWKPEVIGGEARFFCPACIGGAFDAKAKCPKCNFAKVATHYCVGVSCDRGIVREHQHRSCERCRYQWVQNCVGYESPINELPKFVEKHSGDSPRQVPASIAVPEENAVETLTARHPSNVG